MKKILMKKIPTKKILMRKIIVKEKEVARHITEDIEISSDDSDKSDKEQFFYNKRSKKSQHHESFALCKLLPSQGYKEFFLSILSTLPTKDFCSVKFIILYGLAYNTKHELHNLPEPFCIVYWKILKSQENSQLTGKFSTHKKILNS